MKLVIAEKPSVAMSLAAVLGATERKDGYLDTRKLRLWQKKLTMVIVAFCLIARHFRK